MTVWRLLPYDVSQCRRRTSNKACAKPHPLIFVLAGPDRSPPSRLTAALYTRPEIIRGGFFSSFRLTVKRLNISAKKRPQR
jgi:hypothetical protein